MEPAGASQPAGSTRRCCTALQNRKSLKSILWPALALLCCICLDVAATAILASAMHRPSIVLLVFRLVTVLVALVVAVQLGTGGWTCRCSRARSPNAEAPLALPLAACDGSGSAPTSSVISAETAAEQELQRLRSNFARSQANAWKKSSVMALCFLATTAQSIYIGTWVLVKERYSALTDCSLIAVIVLMNVEFALMMTIVASLTEEEGFLVSALHPHSLKFREVNTYLNCGVCGQGVGPQTGGNFSFHCGPCQFDVCLRCIGEVRKRGPGAGSIRRSDKGLKPTEDMSTLQYFGRLLQLVRPFKWLILFACLCVVIAQSAAVLLPLLQGEILNILIKGDAKSFRDTVAVFLALACLAAIFQGLQGLGGSLVQRKISFATSAQMLRNLLRQDIAFFDGAMTGQLTSSMTGDLDTMVDPIQSFVIGFLGSLCKFIGGAVMCLLISWRLTVLTATLLCPVIYMIRLYGPWCYCVWLGQHHNMREADAVALQAFRNVRTIRAFAAMATEQFIYNRYVDQAHGVGNKAAMVGTGYFAFVHASKYVALVLMFWYGGQQWLRAKDGEEPEFNIGQLLTYNLYWVMVSGSIDGMVGILASFIRAAAASRRVFTILDLEPDIPLDNGLALDGAPCLVEFRDVHFTYQMRPTQKVLKGVSFTLDPGTSVAFVGKSGAGKSTLVNLILRFYDPQEGCVMLNGRPLPDWNLRQHHRRVSVVTQETQIFNRSIRDNLTYGLDAEAIEDDVVVTAAKQANAHEFIADMEMGYKSMTGEGGCLLSGGQKQRLAIARALLRNPSLLLLDEATSALDAESEGLVQGALEAMMRSMVGKTSILLIAHRLSTVISSNKIIVMEAGSVAEQGKHSDLLQQDGAYAALVSSQVLASGKAASEDGTPSKDRAALEANLTGSEETSETSAAGSTSGSALGDDDSQSAEAAEDAGSPASVKKGSEPLLTLKERTEAGSVLSATRLCDDTEAVVCPAAPHKLGSCRACLKYRGKVSLLIMLIVLDYAASISLDLGTKQVVYLVLCSSRLALVILGMFFGVQLGLGLLCGGMQEDDRPHFGIQRAESPSSSLLSSQCCGPGSAPAAAGLSRGNDSPSSGSCGSCDRVEPLGDSGKPVHDAHKSATTGDAGSISSQSTSDSTGHTASPVTGRIEEADARLKRMHKGLEAKEQHLWKRNLVLVSCGVLVTAQSIYCSAHVVNSAGLTLWEAIALLIVIVSMNAQFFVVKNVVDALTEDEGMLIKELHPHRLVYQTNAQGASCSVCSEKLGAKTGGLACLACRTCNFNFRTCTNCYRKQQVLGKGGQDCSFRSDKGPRPSLELSSLDLIMRMSRVMKSLRCIIAVLCVSVLLEQLGSVLLPACGGRIFDVLLEHKEELFSNVLTIYVVIAVVTHVFHLLSVLTGQYAGQGLYFHLRKAIFDSFLQQDMAFFDSAMTGNLTTRMTSDVLHVAGHISEMLTSVLPSIMLLIGGTFMCFRTSWEMTVLCCAMVGPVMYITRLYAQYGKKVYLRIMAAKADANSVASESLKNVRIVRAYAADHVEMMDFDKHINVAAKAALQAAWCDAGVSVLSGLKDFGTLAVILWFGGLTILSASWSGFQPRLTMGQLVTYNLFWTMMTSAAQSINNSLNKLIQGNSAAMRVFEIIDFKPDIELEVGLPLPSGPLEIAFQDVHFTYQMRPDKRVLNGLSFKIPAGESVAVVGRSGSGKSTLVNMIMRYYDPQGGQILANGRPLPEWHLLKYVRRVGVVTQETQVFCRSIWENLVYGLQHVNGIAASSEAAEVDESKVVAAAEKANIHSFIVGLDEGYKSRVGEGGVNLSGGQKQRLAIARALLRSPSLLLLDEATSALDAVNEALVQEALEGMVQAMAGNCSVMLIAHRLSTVVKSDNILVMDRGEAVESGKHEQLLSKAGVYAQLVQRQVAAQGNTLEE